MRLCILIGLLLISGSVYAENTATLLKTTEYGQTLGVEVKCNVDGQEQTFTRPVFFTSTTDKEYVMNSVKNVCLEYESKLKAEAEIKKVKPEVDKEINKPIPVSIAIQ